MCGTVKFEGYDVVRCEDLPEGAVTRLSAEVIETPSVWNGFARRETLDSWMKKGWEPGLLNATGFIERGVDFDLEDNEYIGVVMKIINKKNRVNIVTRRATKEEILKTKHNRMPAIAEIKPEDTNV